MKHIFYLLLIVLQIGAFINSFASGYLSNIILPKELVDADITSVAVIADNVYVGTKINGLFFSSDGGRTFNSRGENISGLKFDEIIIRHKNMYAFAGDNLYKSDDKGVNWILIGAFQAMDEKIKCVYITNNEEIYIGTNRALYFSRDEGGNWDELTVGLKTIDCFAVTVNEQGYIFLSFSRGERVELRRTTDIGQNWVPSSYGIEGSPEVSSFAQSGNNIYASVYSNVYFTGNNGDDWILIPSTFQFPIRKLEISKDEYLIARFDDFISIYDKGKNGWVLKDEDMRFKDTIKASYLDDSDNIFIATDKELSRSLGDIKIFLDFYPSYFITIVDINNNPIPNKLFYLIKNGYNIGSVTTDSYGKFHLSTSNGDSLKVELYPGSKAAVKPGHNTCNGNTMYYMILDNAKFDGTGNISYFRLEADLNPTIIVDHTTIKMSLIISLGWDAKRTYMDSLALWFKQLSNYYYDVTDGQLFFHQIDIYDGWQKWDECDVRVFADNGVWPNASVGGIFSGNKDHHANLPRKWYGNSEDTRNFTARNDWLTTYNDYHWTTIGHELGHYMMAFYDEYVYVNNDGSGLPNGYNYGFMDYQYPNGGDWSTEMSNATRYPNNTYKITAQWVYNSGDCWTDFEGDYEKTYNGVFCPIIKPSERTLNPGSSFLPGPIRNVSSNLITNIYDFNTGAGDVNIVVFDPNRIVLNRATIDLYKPLGLVTLVMKQGQNADDGTFKVIGANINDVIRMTHVFKNFSFMTYSYTYNVTSVSTAEKGQDQTQQEEPVEILMREVNGIFNQVNVWEFDENANLTFKTYVNKEFSQAPKLEVPTGQDILETRDLAFNKGKLEYNCNLDTTINSRGLISINAFDDSQELFYVPISYSITGYSPILSGPDGDLNLYLDQRNSQISKFAILSSGFHTSRRGLDADAEQSGNVHSITTYPYPISTQIPSILQIGYSTSELINKSQSLLRIFMWDVSSLKWVKVGGIVDSIRHYIRVPITTTGTYAVFTSNNPDAVDEGSLYHDLQISPNPCDELTTITYTNLIDEVVSIYLINTFGKELAVLSNNTYLSHGNHKLEINTSTLPIGTYFISLKSFSNTQIVKFIVLR